MILIEKMETLSLGKLSMNLKITAIENSFCYDDPNPIIRNFQSVSLPLVCVHTRTSVIHFPRGNRELLICLNTEST